MFVGAGVCMCRKTASKKKDHVNERTSVRVGANKRRICTVECTTSRRLTASHNPYFPFLPCF